MINNKLTWDSNTTFLVKKANARMRMLHKLVTFNVPIEDLKTIYILYIRSHLEQSCQVWHSSLTLENLTDIERVQKNALKIILQDKYESYAYVGASQTTHGFPQLSLTPQNRTESNTHLPLHN